MAFRDLDEFLIVPPLVLPIHGKQYSFPGEISARSWLRLQMLYASPDPEQEAFSDEEEASLRAEMFGEAEAEMVADGCTTSQLRVAFYTLLAYHMSGMDAAESVWAARGEAPAPNRATRRSRPPAKSTRSRGSRVGSTGRKKRPAAAPVGETSSSSGD